MKRVLLPQELARPPLETVSTIHASQFYLTHAILTPAFATQSTVHRHEKKNPAHRAGVSYQVFDYAVLLQTFHTGKTT